MPKISLQAIQAYSKVNSKNFGEGFDTLSGEGVSFKNMVHNTFNAYATMSPDQILSHIKTQANSVKMPSGNFVAQAISAIKEPVQKAQIVTKKALIGEASILELSTRTKEATIAVKTIVAFRDQLSQQWDKIFNMQL
jgi:flagellar hook-basal body complex protein FliE